MTTALVPAPLPDAFTCDVEWADIHNGVGCSTKYCPLALAVGRALRELGICCTDISVNHHGVEVITDWRMPAVRYWHSAETLVGDWDAHRHVEPCSVSLIRMQRAAAREMVA